MFALDLFNNDHERRLAEGAVDQLEQRRIDDLAMKMDDLVARAKKATTPEVKAALVKEFQKCKAERDSYYKVRNETMGYGGLVGEAGIPGNVPAEKIPGKEDLLKGKGRTYYEGDVTPVKGGIRHHAKPGNYGGYEPEADPLARLDKHAVNRADKAMGVKFDREKKYQGGLDLEVDEAGIPGSVPTEKIPGKEDLLKGKGRSYYEDQKKNLDLSKGVIPTEPLPEHGGGIGPKQHWQDLMQENRLAVGDPIVVTGPNEFEGKTGEIYDFAPSGTFVIVDLYNHGKHSMHLSDIAYNEYADQEQDEEDDWYDDEVDEGYASTIRPDPAPMDPAKQWKFQVRQLIADYIKNPDGLYNLAKRNGPDSAEAVAYEYIVHPKGKIALPHGAVALEGFQDFNKVEPYAVCLAGKPVKKFDYYEQARRFHDNWKKKLYNQGDQAKADKITLMPLNLDETGKGTPVPAKEFARGVLKDLKKVNVKEEGRVDPILIKALKRMPDGLATHHEVLDAAYDAYAMELGYLSMKGNYGVTDVYIPKLMGLYKDKHGLTFNEAETDYSKRRQRERDVDAGKPVPKQRPSKMTDYQKRRTQDKKDMALGEDQDTSGVESAIIRRIMVAHTDLLRQFGPEKVMQAAEEVAYNVGDVDEIGTSDVSAYVAQVKQILGVPEELDEKWSQKYKSSINCANPKGFSQKAHCAGKKK